MTEGICLITECVEQAHHRRWCLMHYTRWLRTGTTDGGYLTLPIAERFHLRYELVDGDCWRWTGGVNSQGYARLSDAGRRIYAHRWAYEHFVGPIPAGLDIDHLCHTNDPTCRKVTDCPHRRCVNPAHMEVVTRQENLRRSRRHEKVGL